MEILFGILFFIGLIVFVFIVGYFIAKILEVTLELFDSILDGKGWPKGKGWG